MQDAVARVTVLILINFVGATPAFKVLDKHQGLNLLCQYNHDLEGMEVDGSDPSSSALGAGSGQVH